MLKRLRLKFVCINMLLVTLMLVVIFAMVFGFTRAGLERESLRMMRSIAEHPYQLGAPLESSDGVRLPYFAIQVGLRGEIVATSGGYYDLSDREYLLEVLSRALETSEQSGVLEEYGLRFYRGLSLGGECLVFADLTSEQATLERLLHTCILLGIAGFLGFLVVSLLLARWAVKPVDEAWTQQRQFVSDASHELKTPLAVILTNAELLQDPACEPETQTRSIDNILTMAHQMRGLVEGLLELARADNGTARQQFQPVSWSSLVEDGLLPFEPLLFEAGLTLDAAIEPGLTVSGSEQQLRQVLDILLDNARKYSDPGGAVLVRLRRQGGHGLLTVSTPGQALTPEECKSIFRRFYRADKARAMSGSYGLGLSIAESLLQTHKGKIWADSSPGQNSFHVQLPLL